MNNFKWSNRSLKAMSGIHVDLRTLCDLALKFSKYDFVITEGRRTLEKQKKYVAQGASWTLKSNHLDGHAIDYAVWANGNIRFEWVYMREVADAFKKASKQLNIKMKWGGDWKTTPDGCHIELDRKYYPRE